MKDVPNILNFLLLRSHYAALSLLLHYFRVYKKPLFADGTSTWVQGKSLAEREANSGPAPWDFRNPVGASLRGPRTSRGLWPGLNVAVERVGLVVSSAPPLPSLLLSHCLSPGPSADLLDVSGRLTRFLLLVLLRCRVDAVQPLTRRPVAAPLIVWEFLVCRGGRGGGPGSGIRVVSVGSGCCGPPRDRKPVPGLLHVQRPTVETHRRLVLEDVCVAQTITALSERPRIMKIPSIVYSIGDFRVPSVSSGVKMSTRGPRLDSSRTNPTF